MSDLAARIDALSAEDLRARGSMKWTGFPGAIGAWVAETDFDLAPAIQQAVDDSHDRRLSGYVPLAWREEVKAATAEFQARHFGWQIDPERIFIMPDVLTPLAFTMMKWLPSGSKIVVPTPCYMPFVDMPGAFGHQLVQLPMIPTPDGWEFDFDGLAAAFEQGARMLILCNPHNPTGKVHTAGELRQIAEIVERYGGLVFSDEIHSPITFAPARHLPYATVSPAAAQHSITAVAASKAFNIAGFKCAQMVLTNDAQARFYSSQGHGLPFESTAIGVSATIAAYRNSDAWLAEMLAYLDGNRRFALEAFGAQLPEVVIREPQGTYLMWLDARQLGLADPQQHFLAHGVALTDGAGCGDAGRGWVRFNYAMPRRLVAEAIDKMAASLR